ncbi:MAG: type II CRISPR-associated endonuclease Cas1 [Cytophagales bacterium]
MMNAIGLTQPAYLSVEEKKLRICFKETGEVIYRPFYQLGYLLIDHPQITLSKSLLATLSAHNVALIVTNPQHMPVGMMLPLATHHMANFRFRAQLEAPLPLKKQLWKRFIKKKITNQAQMLQLHNKAIAATKLRQLAQQVISNDNTNRESAAATCYWKALFGSQFVREQGRKGINGALNYGYAILRALMGRSLLRSGLLPIAGIHHHNRYNPYCLADDAMEPYRPFVDHVVYKKRDEISEEALSVGVKKQLLNLFTQPCQVPQGRGQLFHAIELTTASLANCFETKKASPLQVYTFTPAPHAPS